VYLGQGLETGLVVGILCTPQLLFGIFDTVGTGLIFHSLIRPDDQSSPVEPPELPLPEPPAPLPDDPEPPAAGAAFGPAPGAF
jgi:hypothetical protein